MCSSDLFFTCADSDTLFAGLFGFIDIPTSFDYVKGVVTFQGWALGETQTVSQIEIYVDGNFIGIAQLGLPRPDVLAQYGYINAAATSGWRFNMDTTKLGNGRHRLTVRALSGTRPAEIGSVDFYTQNPNLVPKGLSKTND